MELTFKDRLACKVLSHLRYDKVTDKFYACKLNDCLLAIAKRLLGMDPVEFMVAFSDVLGEDPEGAGLYNLRH